MTDDVLLHRALRDERGLRAHREAGAAAAAQAGLLERRRSAPARDLQRLAQRAVAAAALVDLERREARLVDVLEQQRGRSWLARTFGSALGRRFSCLSGSGSSPARIWRTSSGTSSSVDRADVLAVDRGHRRDVAGAQALEAAQVEVRVAGRPPRAAPRAARRRRTASTRCSCRRRPSLVPDGARLEHVVEGRDRGQVGGRQAHHAGRLLDALRRAPAVAALDGEQRGDRGRAAVGVLGHRGLDLGAQVGGHRRARGVGDAGRVLVEVGGVVPARDARALLEADDAAGSAAISGPPRRAPGRASPASRSCRRCSSPSTIGAVACRFTKLGSRMCTRAGLLEPSARTKQPSSPRGPSIG